MVTLPSAWFAKPGAEKGIEAFLEGTRIPGSTHIWATSLPSMPMHDVAWCYLVWKGKVRWRMNIAGFSSGFKWFAKEGHPGQHQKVYRKQWMELCGPAEKAPEDMPMKGFRGFGYTRKLF